MGCKNCKNTVSPSSTIAGRTKTAPATSNDDIPTHLRNFEAENLENVTLIWLDESIDETKDDFKKTLLLLRTINDFVLTYTDAKSCIEYTKSVEKESVLLILSGSLSKDVLPRIAYLRQLDSVFIFCSNRTFYEHLKQDYSSKVVDIFTEQESLMKSIRQQLHLISKQTTAFSFFNQKQKFSRNLTKEAASFLWFQLLFTVLKELPHTEDAKNEMLVKCEEYYRGNRNELKNIERFRRTYEAKDAIAWYTDECFVYRLLNRALRTEDIDGLYLFRFYIIDLCKQLEEESRKNVGTLTLYRGQAISEQEVDRLKHSVGSLTSTNGFFSTTLVKTVAMSFLQQAKRHDLEQVLFEITADSSVKSVVFADIEEFSRIKGEHEVLFGISVVFKIEGVYFSEEMKCWLVQMAATNEGMENVQDYTNATKKQYEDIEITVIFGRLLTEMNELTKAEKYFNLLLMKAEKDSLAEADLLNEMGLISYFRHERSSALEYYTRAYEIQKARLRSNHPKIAHSLTNIADVYCLTRNYEKVKEYNIRALDIYRENYGKGDHIAIAKTLSNLGQANCFHKRDFDSALDYFTQSLQMRRRLLPQEHADIAHALWDIGNFYEVQKDHDRSLQYYFDALKIFEKILPPGHEHTSRLINMIADALEKENGSEAAFYFYHEKWIQLCEELGEKHTAVGRILSEIGDIAQNSEVLKSNALPLYEKALLIFEECNPPEKEQIWHCLRNMATIQAEKENFQMALDYYSKQLDIGRKMYFPDDFEIGFNLYNIGLLNSHLKNYDDALKFLQDAFKIYEKTLPAGDKKISDLLGATVFVFKRKGHYAIAFEFCEKKLLEMREVLGEVHPAVGKLICEIGGVFREYNDNDNALAHYKEALSILEKCVPSQQEQICSCLNSIALIRQDKENFESALKYFTKKLDIEREIYLPDDRKIGTTLWNIGAMHLNLKKYEDALKYFEDALDIYEKQLPAGHDEISKLFVNIVDAYKGNDNYEAAFTFCQKKLIVLREEVGDTHEAVGRLLFRIGELFRERNNNDEALSHFEKALSIFEKCSLIDQEPMYLCINRIAFIQQQNGNFQLALDYRMKDLEIGRKMYLPDHADNVATLREIGYIHRRLKNYEDALKYLEEALDILQSKHSYDHKEVQETLEDIVDAYKGKGDHKAAFNFCQKKLNDLPKELGELSPAVGHLLRLTGDIFRDSNDYAEALSYYEKALSVFEKCNPPEQEYIRLCLQSIGVLEIEKQNFQLALDYFCKQLDTTRRIYLSDDPKIGFNLYNIGLIHFHLENYDDALKFLGDALKIYEKIYPVGHEYISDVFDRIIQVYKGKDDYESAFNLCQSKLTKLRKESGEAHLAIGRVLFQLADISQKRNDNDTALSHFEKAMSTFEKCAPPEQKQISNCLYQISEIHEKNENFQMALEHFLKQLDVERRICLPDDLTIGYCFGNIGETWLKLKNYNDAMKYLEDALKIFQLKYADDHEHVKWVLENIDEVKKAQMSNSHLEN